MNFSVSLPGNHFIFGLGHGMNIPSIMSLMAGYAPMEHRGILMSVNGTVLRLGQTMGPLVMGLPFALWGITVIYRGQATYCDVPYLVGRKCHNTRPVPKGYLPFLTSCGPQADPPPGPGQRGGPARGTGGRSSGRRRRAGPSRSPWVR